MGKKICFAGQVAQSRADYSIINSVKRRKKVIAVPRLIQIEG